MTSGTVSRQSRPPADGAGWARMLANAPTETRKIECAAGWVLGEFDAYFIESRAIPGEAKKAFELRDRMESLSLSKRRLSIYSESIRALAPRLKEAFPQLLGNEALWRFVEALYLPLIEGRYEADLAFAYIHSVKRMIYQNEWIPVEYAVDESIDAMTGASGQVYLTFPGGARLSPETVSRILRIPGFAAPFEDIDRDAELIAQWVNRELALDGPDAGVIRAIHMIDAGFYRNRGAYLVGRLVLGGGGLEPFVISLENDENGIYADAVLTSEAHTHNIFSSTLANFHVTNTSYHELAAFLHSIMPQRPRGLHYSTIGFNHVGKVAAMNDLKDELADHGEVFEAAVGARGTVAIAFSAPSSGYVLKVIRDAPTAQYKWGQFDGVQSVLDKYRRVHEINRTGSMMDSLIYYNLKLDAGMFEPSVLEELLSEAPGCASLRGASVVFRHLIVQMKMVPVPVFLETATEAAARTVIANLGDCIKNNAAADVFNKDLDIRNYGVGHFLKVFLFDYDALERFTEVKIRTNLGAIDGEEDIPEWVFEDGFVFLPEEMVVGLRIPDHDLSRLFRRLHKDLLTPGFWRRLQDQLGEGRVPRIRVYPEHTRLQRREARLGAYG